MVGFNHGSHTVVPQCKEQWSNQGSQQCKYIPSWTLVQPWFDYNVSTTVNSGTTVQPGAAPLFGKCYGHFWRPNGPIMALCTTMPHTAGKVSEYFLTVWHEKARYTTESYKWTIKQSFRPIVRMNLTKWATQHEPIVLNPAIDLLQGC